MFIISDMGILHFICALFYCTPQIMSCFLFCFYKFVPQVCGNSGWNKSIGTIFLTASAHFVSLCHISLILTIFPSFSSVFYLLWWSETSDLSCYYCNCFERHKLRVPTAPLTSHAPRLSLSWGLPIPWDTILKLGQLITLHWPLSVQVRGTFASLSL